MRIINSSIYIHSLYVPTSDALTTIKRRHYVGAEVAILHTYIVRWTPLWKMDTTYRGQGVEGRVYYAQMYKYVVNDITMGSSGAAMQVERYRRTQGGALCMGMTSNEWVNLCIIITRIHFEFIVIEYWNTLYTCICFNFYTKVIIRSYKL